MCIHDGNAYTECGWSCQYGTPQEQHRMATVQEHGINNNFYPPQRNPYDYSEIGGLGPFDARAEFTKLSERVARLERLLEGTVDAVSQILVYLEKH